MNPSIVRSAWREHGQALLLGVSAIMAAAAVVWLGYQFWRLLWQGAPLWTSSGSGAVDLRVLAAVTQRWFRGSPVYTEMRNAVLPPATYAMLWPLLGWLPLTVVRWLWAIICVAALGWLVYLVEWASGADTLIERVFVGLIPLSIYATGAAIGNGQLIVPLLPALLAGLLLLREQPRGDRRDFLAAVFVLLALVKPSIAAPFLWIVLFVPGRLRPALLVASGYTALTLLAAAFQARGLPSLLRDWLARASDVASRQGYADLHIALAALGLQQWLLPASLLVLAGLGVWIYRRRRADLWFLMGVTAIIARFWTYHRWYDDLVLLLPMIALWRIARRGPVAGRSDIVASLLFTVSLGAMLAPGGLYLLPPPWNEWYVRAQVLVWAVVLVFLVDRVRRETSV